MSKANFFFWSLLLLTLALVPAFGNLSGAVQNGIAAALILLLGVPHGAIDNSIYLQKSKQSVLRFFVVYIGVIFINVALWLIFPVFSIVFFLALSAYHFGQSQFSEMLALRREVKVLLYLTWGASVLSAFFYFNVRELQEMIASFTDLEVFMVVFKASIFRWILILSGTMFLILLIGLFIQKKISLEPMAVELLIFAGIMCTAFLLPFLPGFALFFVVIHSYKVLRKEFFHFFSELNGRTIWGFLKKLMPLTIISYFGIGFLLVCLEMEWIGISLPLLLLILISSITIPHAYVMERFYA